MRGLRNSRVPACSVIDEPDGRRTLLEMNRPTTPRLCGSVRAGYAHGPWIAMDTALYSQLFATLARP